MQSLAALHLDRTLAGTRAFLSNEVFGVSPKVSLPCPARLYVNAPLATVVALLSCINIPSATCVGLEIESDDNSSADDYRQLLLVLAQKFSESEDPLSSNPTIRSLVIYFATYDSESTIRASEHIFEPNLSRSYTPEDHNIPLMIRFREVRSGDHIIGNICCSIPSAHAQTLHVVNPSFSHDFWRKTLGHLDGLQHLAVCLIWSLCSRSLWPPQ